MDIIRAIVAGQHDPQELVKFRNIHCQNPVEVMFDALTGNYKAEHLFTLKQSLELVDFYAEQLKACDQVIESKLKQLQEMAELPQKPLSKRKKTGYCANAPDFDVRGALYNLLGIDLTEIHGIGPSLALKLVVEPICQNGHPLNTLRRGFAWRPAIKFQEEKSYRVERADHQAGLLPIYDLRPQQ